MFSAVMLLEHPPLRLLSLEITHLATSKHIIDMSKLVLFVLIGGFPYLQASIFNRKYIIEFLCTSFAFYHYFTCRCSRYSVFLFLNIKSKMHRCTFNWENPIEKHWEFPYQLFKTNMILFFIWMVLWVLHSFSSKRDKLCSSSTITEPWESAEHQLACLLLISLSTLTERVKNAHCLFKLDMESWSMEWDIVCGNQSHGIGLG